MRTLRSASTLAVLSTLILSLFLLSAICFAAPPDRIAGVITMQSTTALGTRLPDNRWAGEDLGPVEASFPLHNLTLLITPSPSQQVAIDALLAAEQDPGSPLYHKWLTPEEYGSRFGLSQNDIRKVTAWLRSQGFTNISIARSSNVITFSGTAAQVQSVFQTEIHHSVKDGKTNFFNINPPRIPLALSGIVTGMRGLNNFHLKPMIARNRANYNADNSFSGQFLAPADVATIYHISSLYSSGTNGTGETLAIIGQTDILSADISDFRTGFGLSAITGCTASNTAPGVVTACNTSNFQYVLYLPTGGKDPLLPDQISDDLPEADLDIEWSGAIAQDAQIIYVNAPDPNGNGVVDSMSQAITNNVAPVVSMSYGLCELAVAENTASGFVQFNEAEFKQANLQGQTIITASGDTGAVACDPPENDFTEQLAVGGYAVNYPASSPEVTGVGGTMIPQISPNEYTSTYWNSTGTTGGSALSYIPEQAWNDDQEFGAVCAAQLAPYKTDLCQPDGITNWLTAQEAFANPGPAFSAGGGGVSNCATINASDVCQTGYSQPSYQASLHSSAVNPGGIGELSATTPTRYVPDVALLASSDFPGFIYCTPVEELSSTSPYDNEFTSSCATSIADSVAGVVSGNQYVVAPSIAGGTSFATPIFAGIVTLLNQAVGGPASPGLGNINPTLYQLAAHPANAAFNTPAITTGNNGAYCTAGSPSTQPAALQCPSSGANAGFLGFNAANFDPTTNYNLVAGLGSIYASNFISAWSAARTTTSITVGASTSSYTLGVGTVTLTGTLSSSTAVGTISFFDNGSTTALGTATLTSTSAGVGTFTWTPTASEVGTNNISASYSGDGYNAPSSTTSSASVTVTSPDFTIGIGVGTAHTVLAGQNSLAYTFLVAPVGATTFAANVTFACSSFSPTDPTLTASSCTFTDTTQSPNTSIIPAGASGQQSINLVIATVGPNPGTGTQIRRRAENRLPWLPFSLPLAGVVMVGFFGRKWSHYSLAASLSLALVLLALLIACGGGSSSAPVAVSVSPASASLYPNDSADSWPSQTASFMATVTNTNNTAVTWGLSSTASGVSCTASSNPCGTISSTGAYTAPTIASSLPSSVTATATSQADSSAAGTASITLKPATVPNSYVIVVTATEAATNHTQTIALNVQ